MQRIDTLTSSRRLRNVSAQVEVAALSFAGTADDALASAPANRHINRHTSSAFEWRNWSRVKRHHARPGTRI